MRILLMGVDECEQNDARQRIYANICDKYSPCIITDMCANNDVDMATYCAQVRRYDLVLVQFDSAYWANYLELLKTIKNLYENPIKIHFIVNDYCDDWQFKRIKDECDSRYFGMDVSFDTEIMNLAEVYRSMANTIQYFFENNMRFRNFSIDTAEKTLHIEVNNAVVTFKIERSFDFKVLSFFLRHYGETLSINQIISAVCEEPEQLEGDVVKKSLTYLKKLFKTAIGKSAIYCAKDDSKRYNYQLSL